MFEFTLGCMGRGNYVCPPAGPAWRAGHEAGCCDMEELEFNLRLIPWERLQKHDKKLNEWLELEAFLEKLERGENFLRS